MRYDVLVTGIGFCVGNIASHEDLIESVTTGKKPAKQKVKPTASYAVGSALKYKDNKPVLLLSDGEVGRDILDGFEISEYRTVEGFGSMLEEAGRIITEGTFENVLILSLKEEGYAAVLLSGKSRPCFAQVQFENANTDAKSTAEISVLNSVMQFITAAIEIRYAFKLDGSVTEGSCIWHWAEKRALERTIGGVTVRMEEADNAVKATFEAKRYLLPVTFDTAEQAKAELLSLQKDAAERGLYRAMESLISRLKEGKRGENIIVLLAENYESLKQQTDELLAQSNKLLSDGFSWNSKSGSIYLRRTTKTPKVVFMNPPGGMFNSKPFHRYVSKLFDFIESPIQFGRGVFSHDSQNELLHRYMQEINITYVVMYLLEAVGICPDYLSGASMGEIVFDISNCALASTQEINKGEAWEKASGALEAMMRRVLEDREKREMDYFGHTVDLAKYYLKCDSAKATKAIEKYDDVFVFIEGSPKDLLICGERASCLKLIGELGCLPMEMGDPIYVHTPVLECEHEKIRAEILDVGMYLDVDDLPYKLFSTYFKKSMDSTSQMFADNFASIITRKVNYTEAVEALYAQDARVFIDLSTTQLCGGWAANTLSPYSDAQVLSIYEEKDTAEYLLDMCAVMLSGNVAFDFDKIYSRLSFVCDATEKKAPEKTTEIRERASEITVQITQKNEVKPMAKETTPKETVAATDGVLQQYIVNQMTINQRAYEMYLDAEQKLFAQIVAAQAATKPSEKPFSEEPKPAEKKPYLWDRQQVIEMTENSMASVLGDKYKEVDKYPVRARMPLPPFMFVSRVVSIDAEYGVLRPSSIVSEYDIDEDCVFRMGDELVSPLIGSEASHIGIFLLAYMGIDAIYDGKIIYRAIGSEQTMHSEKPFRVGDTMRTVLRINRFVNSGSTVLIFFTFETYNGEELISVTETTGGFFTKEELTSNKGIISAKSPAVKVEPKEFLHFRDTDKTSYDKDEMLAFYRGDYETCFGNFQKPSMKETYYIPHDLKMIDRVTKIDYNGGMYGRGLICAEKQLTPDMWPFKAHFKNDPVFPAIIMTDGVNQLGAFLFAHSGLLSQFGNTAITAIKGNCTTSKFRGQARHGYSTLSYEVHVKDVVQTEDAICVYFDAKIFNDGLQIIQVDSYALKVCDDPN